MARTKAVAVASKPNHYNQQRMIDLWNSGKSVTQIAEQLNASPVWTRRVIATKAPQDYKKGLAARHADVPQARATTSPRASAGVRSNGGGRNGQAMDKDMVKSIAASVASAAFSNATFTPQPQTRDEMFDNIQRGVREGIKKFGFHS